ncbi:MAG: acireductone synthase [Bacteroidota bacterium]
MKLKDIKYILTDIEGTTSSVQFVFDTLFPYFRNNIGMLKSMTSNLEVQKAFKQTVELASELENKKLHSVDDIINSLHRWSEEDRKLTPLKTVQGILWATGYESGELKGHVYPDVKPAFIRWKEQGIDIGIFSSGSIAAQKQIFGFSEEGDLTTNLSHYFDTTTGGKRDVETYNKISTELQLNPNEILFLSDIHQELEAADEAGFKTVQLVREGTEANWEHTVVDFSQIIFNK